MAIVVTKEEKILRDKRHKQFVYLLDKYKVRTRKLALLTGIEENNLSSYKSGKQPITEHTMERIMRGFEILDQELLINKPNVEVEDWDYIIQQLKLHGNVSVKKNKIKDIDKYMVDLKMNGFVCTYTTDRDGDYVFFDTKQHKPMVEKVIQPAKPKIEQDLSIIDKVRNMHQDSLVMHEEALKLQVETDEIVKSVDDMEAKFDLDKPEYKMPKFAPGSSVTGAFGLSVEPVEEIIIAKEDIEKALAENTHYELPWEEEEELKELAEETLTNFGLEKGIHSVDLVEFLETRLTKLEVRGFLRGKAIESLLEEDYKTAAMCIKYFTDNGYIEVGEGV